MTNPDLWTTILKLASVPLLVLLNGFFVAAEFALVKIRDTQLEELVGPIEDEFRHEEPRIRRTGKETWEINGSLRVREFGELIGKPLKDTAASTVSGLVIQNLGRFARPGDVFTIDGSELRVEETKGTRITKIKLTHPHSAARMASRKIGSLTTPVDLRQIGPATAQRDYARMEDAA